MRSFHWTWEQRPLECGNPPRYQVSVDYGPACQSLQVRADTLAGLVCNGKVLWVVVSE